MKRPLCAIVCMFASVAIAILALFGCGAQQAQENGGTNTSTGQSASTDQSSSKNQVADSSDMAEPVALNLEGLKPVAADALVDGTYDIDVESSSSMFRITSCKLTVENGAMKARMTMSGKGYLYVYPGTAEQAAAANEADYISFEEDGDAHVFTIPVKALNEAVPCAAFSKKKEIWYDRDLAFKADSLPKEAFRDGASASGKAVDLKDGAYTVAVTLEGGSGRATVESPARIVVKDGKAVARIVWSSPNYDYMVVDGNRLEPVNNGGNSEFDVPVAGFDYRMPVTADTTAMSTPHEIEYTLLFDSSTVTPTNE